jgi:hypothetical protein
MPAGQVFTSLQPLPDRSLFRRHIAPNLTPLEDLLSKIAFENIHAEENFVLPFGIEML